MNIVLEGADASGKSTLASALAHRLGYSVQPGEGPIRRDGEMLERLITYFVKTRTIFDRVGMVSEPIYAGVMKRRELTEEDQRCIREFYAAKPFLIYCIGPGTLDDHTATHAQDTPEFLDKLAKHHHEIVQAYDEWGAKHASFFYTRGVTSLEEVLRAVKAHMLVEEVA